MEPGWQRQAVLLDWDPDWNDAVTSAGYPVAATIPLPEGLGNSNFCVSLQDGRTVRVRHCSSDASGFWGEDIGRKLLPDAKWVLSRLAFIPDHNLAIYPWYEGQTLQQIGLIGDSSEVLAALENCGTALGAMTSVKLPSAGLFGNSGEIEQPWQSVWDGYLEFWNFTLDSSHLHGRIEPALLAALDAGLQRREKDLRRAMEIPVLTHGDFKPSNIVISDGQVRVILDWDFVHSGSWLMSAGQLLRFTGELRKLAVLALERGLAVSLDLPKDWHHWALWVDVLSLVNLISRPLASEQQVADIQMLLGETLAEDCH
jgi:hypothetical protein